MDFNNSNSKFKIEMGTPQPITERTFAFAVRIVNLCKVLDESPGVARTMSRQLIRSGTSIEQMLRSRNRTEARL